jgi:NitT/TauT family transport system substrate-binding protein
VASAPAVLPPTPAQLGVQLTTFFGPEAFGVYDADTQGFYKELAIEVGVNPGAPDQDPVDQVMADGGPEVLMAPVPYVMQADERKKADLVLIALLFQHSGTLLVAPRPTALDSLATLKGKTVGLLDLGGRGLEVLAALAAAGLKTGSYKTVGGYDFVTDPTAVPITGLLRDRQAAAVEATTYDEYAQLLEFGTDSGADPYQPSDLTVRTFDGSGDAMLGMGIFVRRSWLADPANRDAAVRFLRGTFEGYADCATADSNQDCAQGVVDAGNPLPIGHQQWAVNEVNALMWPAPAGIGSLPDGALAATAAKLIAAGLLATDPGPAFVDTSLADDARKAETAIDLTGAGFAKAQVPITPGGVGTEPQSSAADEPSSSPSPSG